MMSKRCKYALKAMVRLARNYKNGFLSTAIIAIRGEHSQKFLEQILLELKRAKLVNSKQGIGGGYYLLKSPDEVSLADFVPYFRRANFFNALYFP